MAELMTGGVDWNWDVPKEQAERLGASGQVTVEKAKALLKEAGYEDGLELDVYAYRNANSLRWPLAISRMLVSKQTERGAGPQCITHQRDALP